MVEKNIETNTKLTEGTEIVHKERQKQIKYGYTIEKDIQINYQNQLVEAAIGIVLDKYEYRLASRPKYWCIDNWIKTCKKTKTKRITIASAFLIAELDRKLHTKEAESYDEPRQELKQELKQ